MHNQAKLRVKKPSDPSYLYLPYIRVPRLFISPYVCIDSMVYAHKASKNDQCIEMTSAHRENHNVSINDEVCVQEYHGSLRDVLLVRLRLTHVSISDRTVSRREMCEQFVRVYGGHPINRGQLLFMRENDEPVKAEITEIVVDGEGISTCGLVGSGTNVHIFTDSPYITIDQPDDENVLLRGDFDFFSLGIGGLKDEFALMFRRAFLSRIYRRELVDRLQISHIKGIILYGPPGTGKTLIARQIGKLLNAREPKIINGPEVLNKYVGQSEENIRELFKDAEREWRKRGSRSSLHIIIFDEIDAICKKRSESSNITDQVVNQLLSKMDGVESLNNILVIGMTNRIDLIDTALLRPGRFEIHLEIGLPSVKDRKEILDIHTAALRKNGVLKGVSLDEIARETNNYTGAELTAVVKSALSYALERGLKRRTGRGNRSDDRIGSDDHNGNRISIDDRIDDRIDNRIGIDDHNDSHIDDRIGSDETGNDGCRASRAGHLNGTDSTNDGAMQVADDIAVTMEDFLKAIDEIKPAFGIDEREFAIYKKNYYSLSMFSHVIGTVKEKISHLLKTAFYNTSNTLLHGDSGVGKTTLAVRTALGLHIPYVKLVSPREVIGYTEIEKIQFIKEVFLNGHKCKQALIIVDDIESLIDYVPLGPRFSNAVLQTIKTFMRMESSSKTFVICTCTSLDIMDELSLKDSFDSIVAVRRLARKDIDELAEQNSAFGSVQCDDVSIRELLGMLDICDIGTN